MLNIYTSGTVNGESAHKYLQDALKIVNIPVLPKYRYSDNVNKILNECFDMPFDDIYIESKGKEAPDFRYEFLTPYLVFLNMSKNSQLTVLKDLVGESTAPGTLKTIVSDWEYGISFFKHYKMPLPTGALPIGVLKSCLETTLKCFFGDRIFVSMMKKRLSKVNRTEYPIICVCETDTTERAIAAIDDPNGYLILFKDSPIADLKESNKQCVVKADNVEDIVLTLQQQAYVIKELNDVSEKTKQA
jgi:hypothetical protein